MIHKFWLAGDKFIPELHLRQPGFTYSACEPFTKHCEKIEKLRKTGNLKHLYRSELEKAVLLMMQHILIVKIWLRELYQIRF